MAEDAKVSQVSELTAYASKMQGFMESVFGNSTALINTMVQKLDELRKKLKKAEQMEAEAVAEYNALIKAMASASDERERRALMAQKSELENKKNKAKRMREIVAQQVTVAQGATIAIIDGTKMFQNKVKGNVDKGRQVIKKSVAQLNRYNEAKKKI